MPQALTSARAASLGLVATMTLASVVLPRPAQAQEGVVGTTQPPPEQAGGRIDDAVGRIQGWFDPTRDGFFPWVGSIMPGGWAAAGGGYRHGLPRGIAVAALAGISLRNYKVLDAGLDVPITADRRVRVDVRTRLLDAPRVHFFGVGNDSTEDVRAHFDFEPKRLDARLRLRPTDRIEMGGGVGLLNIGTGPGSKGPQIGEVFSPADVPGLGQSVNFRTIALYAQADRRDTALFPRNGGWYRAEWQAFTDGSGGDYGHQRVDLDVRHFFPIVDERHAAVARGVFTGTRASGSDTVPHYLMPMLGDGENLRGFANQRYTDRHRLLLQGEYRYRLNETLHLAGFLDLGRVAPRLGDLSLGGLHPGYGVGLRMLTDDGFAVRADLARSSEQWALIVSGVVF